MSNGNPMIPGRNWAGDVETFSKALASPVQAVLCYVCVTTNGDVTPPAYYVMVNGTSYCPLHAGGRESV